VVYWKLFLAFFRIGIFGYGGGPTMLPLFHAECVKKYNWVTADEFNDYVAFGNTLPGPIATKMACYIGYKVKGWGGAIIAIAAVTLPVVVGMIGLLNLVYALKESGVINGMVQAIQPVIGVMMAVMAYETIQKGWQDAGDRKTGIVGMLAISVLGIVLLDLHPGLLVAVTLAGAFLYATWSVRRQRTKAGKMMDKGV
jgi:chromate transporter